MTTIQDDAATLLDAAKARLETTGWVQGRSGTESGPNCGDGAMIYETYRLWPTSDPEAKEFRYDNEHGIMVLTKARKVMNEIVSPAFFIRWQDANDRTLEEVTAKFTEGAAKLREAAEQ